MKIKGVCMKIKGKIKLDDGTADSICMKNLKQYMTILKKNIIELKKIDVLEDYQKEDLENDKSFLKAMKKIYEYLGGNL